jgi:glyoxylase-like metal-dependent hydrolase (beta-lactamase superfamily II)
MTIQVIPGSGFDSNIFLIDGKKPTIIDTGTGMNKEYINNSIESYIDPNKITQIILTHEHYDHVGGTKDILELTNNCATIFAHEYASNKIEQGKSMFANMLRRSMPKIKVDVNLKGNEQLIIGDEFYDIIYTPGHTPGCICLYCQETKTLFSGDTIFSYGSFGRTDLPGGNINNLKKSIKQLLNQNIENIYPGHESIIIGNGNDHIALSYKNVCSIG